VRTTHIHETAASHRAAPVIAVAGMDFEAKIARTAGVTAVYAAHAERLERAFEAALAQGCAGIVSFGTAGGLAPDLAPGAVILADAVEGPAGRMLTDAVWQARLAESLTGTGLTVRRGVLASVRAPLAGAADKAALHQRNGALGVDMESHLAGAWAQRQGVPFAVCRVLVDPAWRSLPRAAIVGLRDDGTTALAPILRELARDPAQLGALLRLAGDARHARRAMTLACRAFARTGALAVPHAA
jgi:hopanoid-associated phosphorylase